MTSEAIQAALRSITAEKDAEIARLKGAMSCAVAAISHVNLGGAKMILQDALDVGKKSE